MYYCNTTFNEVNIEQQDSPCLNHQHEGQFIYCFSAVQASFVARKTICKGKPTPFSYVLTSLIKDNLSCTRLKKWNTIIRLS